MKHFHVQEITSFIYLSNRAGNDAECQRAAMNIKDITGIQSECRLFFYLGQRFYNEWRFPEQKGINLVFRNEGRSGYVNRTIAADAEIDVFDGFPGQFIGK